MVTIYYLYILKCRDASLYSGITTDVKRRVQEHNSSKRGAKYTRSHRPVKLVYTKPFKNRSLAQKAEYKLKSLSHQEKLDLINAQK